MILAILQARISSARLYKKVLKPILGKPMLELQIERLVCCKNIDHLVVATSDRTEDHAIVSLCTRLKVDVFQGSLNNVLDRFFQAARKYEANHVIRLTGDCPLADPEIIDTLVDFYLRQKCDYASNCRPPTLPDGLDAEVFSFRTLEEAWKEAEGPYELEHVTPFIIRRPEQFRIANWRYQEDLSHLRWTVDEPEDFELVREIYEALYPQNPRFRTQDILEFLEKRPELKTINIHHKRNVGAEKAKQAEKELLWTPMVES
jgi:spore coat polysaccharide biosynthesis protein SpsF